MYHYMITGDQLDYVYNMLYRAQLGIMKLNDDYEVIDQTNEAQKTIFSAKYAATYYAVKHILTYTSGFNRSAQAYYRGLEKSPNYDLRVQSAKTENCMSAHRKLKAIALNNTLPHPDFANDFHDKFFDDYIYRKTLSEIFNSEAETLRHAAYRYTGKDTGMSDPECFAAIQTTVIVATGYLALGKDIIKANEASTNSLTKSYILDDLNIEIAAIKKGVGFLNQYMERMNK